MELKAIQLTKQYGSKTAVNHLNLSLSNGVYGLLGANGAGKTTLMRLLCDIQTPTSGKITLDGKNISVLGEKYRNLLGYLPQQFGYYPDFTAWDCFIAEVLIMGNENYIQNPELQNEQMKDENEVFNSFINVMVQIVEKYGKTVLQELDCAA